MDNKALKIGIISGIISSLIVIIFINPILSFVWNVFIAFAGRIHQGYVDKIYRNAALSDRNIIGVAIIIFLLGFMAILLCLIVSLIGSTYRQARVIHLGLRVFNAGILLAVLLCALNWVVVVSLTTGVTEISASFSQRLTVLAPAIDEHEYKIFRAWWASMRGLNDYNSLVSAMDARAKELGISLPPVRKP